MFGKPNEWVHKYRLFDFAIIDVILTIIGAYLISYFSNTHFIVILILLLLLSIYLHKLFCIDTKLITIINKYL
jgi:hypothetical protein